ncbi:MAG: hypothetical protein QF535_03685 [Anaerolineales bacterium]|nr:hypothetical protein [Anaerolineales bacterium]
MTAKIQITDKTNKRTWAIIDGANAIDVSTDLQTVKSNTLKHFYPFRLNHPKWTHNSFEFLKKTPFFLLV